jgi:predicted MFS family arabinose efflux permease
MITTTKGTIEIVYPPYLAGYGYTLSLIGFLTALIAVLQLISRLPVGAAYHTDRVKRQFALALVGLAISTGGFAFAAGEPLLVGGLTVLHGFSFGTLGTLGLALAIDVSGGRRAGVSMAWYTAANSTGYALGALIGGSLADTIGIPATLGLIGILPLIAAVTVMALPPIEAAPFPSDRGSGLRGLLAAGLRLDSRVWLAFVIVLYLNVVMDSVDTFFPVFAPTIGISLAAVGVLRAIKSGSAIFIRSTGVVLLRAVDYRRVTLIAVVAAAAAAMALPLSSSLAVLVPIFVVSGLARGVLRATSAATVAELRNEGHDIGLASGIYNSGLDIGTIVGPALGGVIASTFGIGPMFQIIAALSLIGWLAVAVSSPTTREAAGLAKRHTIGPRA